MTTVRPYQDSIPIALAVEEIRRNAGKSFDSQVVEAFLVILLETLDFVLRIYHTQVDSALPCERLTTPLPITCLPFTRPINRSLRPIRCLRECDKA